MIIFDLCDLERLMSIQVCRKLRFVIPTAGVKQSATIIGPLFSIFCVYIFQKYKTSMVSLNYFKNLPPSNCYHKCYLILLVTHKRCTLLRVKDVVVTCTI